MIRFVLRNWFYPADSLCPACKTTERKRRRNGEEKERERKKGDTNETRCLFPVISFPLRKRSSRKLQGKYLKKCNIYESGYEERADVRVDAGITKTQPANTNVSRPGLRFASTRTHTKPISVVEFT